MVRRLWSALLLGCLLPNLAVGRAQGEVRSPR